MNKLNSGDAFPALSLQLTNNDITILPEVSDTAGTYNVVLFYRGHF